MTSSTVKTAISVDGKLFHLAEDLARRMKVSRSRLFATAVQEFIERRRNQELLERVNAAYAEGADRSEAKLWLSMRRHHRRIVQGRG